VSAVEDGVDLAPLPDKMSASNARLISKNFSRKKLAQQWADLIEGSEPWTID
jgi:hypothetical protein